MLNPLHQLRELHGPGLTGDLLPVFEDGKGRNALNFVLCGQLLVLLGVDFGEAVVGLKLLGCLRKNRGHHLAGATPAGPEVDHNRNITVGDVALEIAAIELDGLAIKQGLAALAALSSIAKPLCGQSIGAIAVWADDMDGITHALLFQ